MGVYDVLARAAESGADHAHRCGVVVNPCAPPALISSTGEHVRFRDRRVPACACTCPGSETLHMSPPFAALPPGGMCPPRIVLRAYSRVHDIECAESGSGNRSVTTLAVISLNCLHRSSRDSALPDSS